MSCSKTLRFLQFSASICMRSSKTLHANCQMSQHWATGQGRFRRVVTRVKGCLYTRSQTFHQIFPAATRASILSYPARKRSPMRSQSPAPSVLIFHKIQSLAAPRHHATNSLWTARQTKTSPTRLRGSRLEGFAARLQHRCIKILISISKSRQQLQE